MSQPAARSHAYGRYQRDGHPQWTHGCYIPEPIPRNLVLDNAVRSIVEAAEWELATLSGRVETLSDLRLFMTPAALSESLSSARIEGSNATLADVVVAESHEAKGVADDTHEVLALHQALALGVERLESMPLAGRLVTDLHEVLLGGGRGGEKNPGHYRTTPVWVGSAGDGPEQASYIPPLPEYLPGLISDWERFVNTPAAMPLVLRLALAHHQFETIHPFLDGNGRMGRLLIGLQMVQEKVVPWPVITLSSAINRHRADYYDSLQGVREKGDWADWITFFATAFHTEVITTHNRIRALDDLRKRMRAEASQETQGMQNLVDILFAVPLVTAPLLEKRLGLSQPTVSRILTRAEAVGWLRNVGHSGRGKKKRYVASHIWAIHTSESPS